MKPGRAASSVLANFTQTLLVPPGSPRGAGAGGVAGAGHAGRAGGQVPGRGSPWLAAGGGAGAAHPEERSAELRRQAAAGGRHGQAEEGAERPGHRGPQRSVRGERSRGSQGFLESCPAPFPPAARSSAGTLPQVAAQGLCRGRGSRALLYFLSGEPGALEEDPRNLCGWERGSDLHPWA